MVPRRAGCFQDRIQIDLLNSAGAGRGTVELYQVLTGLGGVGKTQLAAHHAETLWAQEELDLLVWVTAASRNAVVGAYGGAAERILDIDRSTPQAEERFLEWLASTSKRWLVVLDDIIDAEDLNGLWPPDTRHGYTLVTTRSRDAALTGRGQRIEVGAFTNRESAAYLTATLAVHGRTEPGAELQSLAGELGNLPLALAQAAAYIADAHITCADYRRQLADRSRRLAELAPRPLPDEQPRTLTVTWDLSIERADRQDPQGLARPLLQFTSLLDPNGIPETVLAQPPALVYLAHHRGPAGTVPTGPDPSRPERRGGQESRSTIPVVTAEESRKALRVLHRLSLIDHTPDSPHLAVRVHQLVQRATRDALSVPQQDLLARSAADALLAAWPDNERNTDLALALRANTAALTNQAEEALHRPDAHEALYRAGSSIGDTGQPDAAAEYFRHLVATCRRYLGPDHRNTLIARYNLADWQAEWGDRFDAFDAVDTLLALLPDMERVLGPDHPDTLKTRILLGNCRAKTEGPASAFAALEALLPDVTRVLGPDHPESLKVRRLIAGWQGSVGGLGNAIDAHELLLPDLVRVLGPDHLDTLTARSELASQRGQSGDVTEATQELEELVPDMERVLGRINLYTLKARDNLAGWLGESGDARSAALMYEELLPDLEQVYGPDHPSTEVARSNYDYWYGVFWETYRGMPMP
ncbi:tetratricopeptide repeat protein [Streptomyces sp. W16]|uniref:tetratricopeptide repeat protein n=1 Tax=Streptomyces sp. W16 TaxID=3076631 RepID=UPI00295A99B6|nr:tetratricopeptide repeat protein [Streptomyces sp. W16]MDV9172188.1 tetratricopeptide repeat protein [Streptomyces sp. W16]